MNTRRILIVALLSISNCGAAQYSNSVFSYPHLLPSPYTMPAGRLSIGTGLAFGVTNFLQLSTNIFRDIYKNFNAQAKVAIIDRPVFAAAALVGWEYFETSTAQAVNTVLPGAIISFAPLESLAFFLGGTVGVSFPRPDPNDYTTSGYNRGTNIEADVTWAYSMSKSRVMNALSAGVSYDFSYELVGFGVSHHWSMLQLGAHFYPNAKRYPILPIISGGLSIDF